ncbi:putative hydrolase subunit [Burkholderiales bacterium 8X]|nr:putative hydrolase subunit [Burkholderiales bacterium 8X]
MNGSVGLTILRPGMLASVQDLGRHGHRERGICPGGALDPIGLQIANWLVGNAAGAAGLELTMGGCEIRFERACRIALAGDDFAARLDGQPVWPGWSLPVAEGQVLRLGMQNEWQPKPGLRSWLAVAGGIDVQMVLGSRSTDLKAGFGGLEGRALRRGDALPLGPSELDAEQLARRRFGVRMPLWNLDNGKASGASSPDSDRTARSGAGADATLVLRVMPGPECEQFTEASKDAFWQSRWRITPQSSRMGNRLEGPVLERSRSVDMLSSGVVPGTIQVPPSGQPIVLMGDSQTTGGYPRIGAVIRADLWRLASAPIGGHLRFARVDAAQALAAWQQQQSLLAGVARSLRHAGWPAPSQNAGEGANDAD